MGDLFIKDFPTDLHRDLKIKAAEEGKTLKEVIIEQLIKGVKETKKSSKLKGGEEK